MLTATAVRSLPLSPIEMRDDDLSFNLKRARARSGMTQQEVAEKIGNPVTSISDWERGTRTPGIQILMKMAEAYGITLDELVRGTLPAPVVEGMPTQDEWSGVRLLLRNATKLLKDKSPEAIDRAASMVDAARMLTEND
jgi:transcriptional regulator with XRE-family HTH domain